MSRSSAREALFKLVYEYTMRQELNTLTLAILTKELSEDEISFIKQSYSGIVKNYSDIMSTVEKYSQGFALDRVYKIDLAILAVAIYEIKYRTDIPNSVSANEATELAKTYSTDKSYSFVNGIIASVIKEKNNG